FQRALTLWRCAPANGSAADHSMVSLHGRTFEDAFVPANNVMLANLWGDGLPLLPPTRERVEWILQGAPLPRAHVLGTFPPRGGVATVETCAIALAMAGGRPEYLPGLLAAGGAVLRPEAGNQPREAAPGSARPVV